MRAEEEQMTVARTKKHEEEEAYTGIREAGRENTGTKRETRATKRRKTSKTTNVIGVAFALPQLSSLKTKKAKDDLSLGDVKCEGLILILVRQNKKKKTEQAQTTTKNVSLASI